MPLFSDTKLTTTPGPAQSYDVIQPITQWEKEKLNFSAPEQPSFEFKEDEGFFKRHMRQRMEDPFGTSFTGRLLKLPETIKETVGQGGEIGRRTKEEFQAAETTKEKAYAALSGIIDTVAVGITALPSIALKTVLDPEEHELLEKGIGKLSEWSGKAGGLVYDNLSFGQGPALFGPSVPGITPEKNEEDRAFVVRTMETVGPFIILESLFKLPRAAEARIRTSIENFKIRENVKTEISTVDIHNVFIGNPEKFPFSPEAEAYVKSLSPKEKVQLAKDVAGGKIESLEFTAEQTLSLKESFKRRFNDYLKRNKQEGKFTEEQINNMAENYVKEMKVFDDPKFGESRLTTLRPTERPSLFAENRLVQKTGELPPGAGEPPLPPPSEPSPALPEPADPRAEELRQIARQAETIENFGKKMEEIQTRATEENTALAEAFEKQQKTVEEFFKESREIPAAPTPKTLEKPADVEIPEVPTTQELPTLKGEELISDIQKLSPEKVKNLDLGKIEKLDYKIETADIKKLRAEDKSLDRYLETTRAKEISDADVIDVQPILSQEGQLIAGQELIAQLVSRGVNQVQVFRPISAPSQPISAPRPTVGEAKKIERVKQKRVAAEKIQRVQRKGELAKLRQRILDREAKLEAIRKGEAKAETLKEKAAREREIKKDLVKYVKEKLPLAERGKMLAKIRTAKTEKQFLEAVEQVKKLAEKDTVRNLKADIKKMAKQSKPLKGGKTPKGKFSPEVQRTLDKVREVTSIKGEDITAKLDANLLKYKDQIPPDSIALENYLLSLWGGDAAALAELKSFVKDMIEEGKLASDLKKFNRESDYQYWRDNAIDIVSGGKGLPEGIETIGVTPLELQKGARAWFEKNVSVSKGIYGWTDLMDDLAGFIKAEPGTTWLDKFTKLTEFRGKEDKGIRIATEQMKELFADAYELKTAKQINDRIVENTKKENLGTFKNAKGQKITLELTKNEAIEKYMKLKDPSLRETFRDGMAYTTEIEVAIQNFLSLNDKALGDSFLQWFRDYYKGVNKVYRDMYGIDMPYNEFYSPARRMVLEREADGFGQLLEEIPRRGSVTKGALIPRVKNIRTLENQDVMTMMQQHIAEMEHFKAWAQKVKEMNAVFSDGAVRTAIAHYHGKGKLGVLDGFMRDLTRGGVDKAGQMRRWDRIRGNFSLVKLGLKPAIGVKQLTSFIAGAEKVPVANFTKDLVGFFRNPVQNAKTLYSSSEILKARGSNMERDVKTLLATDEYSMFRKNPNFKNSLMMFIQAGDQGAIILGGWPVYKYNLEQGLKAGKSKSEAHLNAIREFEEWFENTQQSANIERLSEMQRGGTIQKFFTAFKSSQNMYFRKILHALRNTWRGRGSKAQHAKTFAIYYWLLPMFFQWVSDAFKWDWEEQKRALMLGPLDGWFIAGDMIGAAVRAILGQRVYPLEAPVMTIADDAIKALRLFDDDDITTEDIINAFRGIGDATGAIALKGIPLGQTVNIGIGIKDMFQGEFDAGLAEFLGWSPYAVEKTGLKSSSSSGGPGTGSYTKRRAGSGGSYKKR